MKKLRVPYWYLLVVPLLFWLVGSALNMVATALNNGQMPVLFPGGCDTEQALLYFSRDVLHSCMSHGTRLKVISDWLVLNDGVASPGDVLLHAYDATFIPGLAAWIALISKDYDGE